MERMSLKLTRSLASLLLIYPVFKRGMKASHDFQQLHVCVHETLNLAFVKIVEA